LQPDISIDIIGNGGQDIRVTTFQDIDIGEYSAHRKPIAVEASASPWTEHHRWEEEKLIREPCEERSNAGRQIDHGGVLISPRQTLQ
jgi:hypothetical protein